MSNSYMMGIITVPGTIYHKMIGITSLKTANTENGVSIKLKDDVEWELGIDQSTSCTGICLHSSDDSIRILLDIKRDKNAPKSEYFRELKYFLKRLAKGHKFSLIVNELPVKTDKNRSAGDVLKEFLGHLHEWIEDDIPEFTTARHEELFPQTWKSQMMDKSKGTNRSKIKSEVAADITDKYPDLKPYYEVYQFSDYDSFDATGLLEGFKKYAFDAEGNEMIHGYKEHRHTSLVGYKWIDTKDLENQDLLTMIFDKSLAVFKPRVLMYNECYSLHNNIRMASSNWPIVVSILPHKTLQPFQWEYNIDIHSTSHVMVMVVFKKSELSRNDIKVVEYLFPWNKEVYDEQIL